MFITKNNFKKLSLTLIFFTSLLTTSLVSAKEISFSILHTNDMHGRMLYDERNKSIGLAKLKTVKDQINPTLMLDAGDSIQGLPISNSSKGLDMAKGMTMIPYDATTAGNHEFDFSYNQAMLIKQYTPLVSANVYKDGALSFDPYKIIEKDGTKFAIIGLTTPETSTKTHPKNIEGVTFENPIPTAHKYMDQLKDQADVFIFLVHLGIDATTPVEWQSRGLAKDLNNSYPDNKILIIDGHSHTEIQNGEKYGNVLLAQTGNYLNNIGQIKATYSDDKESKLEASLIPFDQVKDVTPDPDIDKFVNEVSTNFNNAMAEVILENNPVLLEGKGEDVRTKETNLGNLIGDALYNYGQTGFSNKSDLAIINGGGVRQSINAGKVTRGDVLAVLPFGNTISQVAANGNQLYQMFEHSLRSIAMTDENGKVILDEKGLPALDRNGGFLQVSSSVKVYYDSNLQGAVPENNTPGNRVLNIQILNKDTNKFEDVDPNKIYYVTTNDFLAAGGDGFTMLGGNREEGPSMDEVFTDYIKSHGITEDSKTPFPYQRIIPTKKENFIDSKDKEDKLRLAKEKASDEINKLAFLTYEDKKDFVNKIIQANNTDEIDKILSDARDKNKELENEFEKDKLNTAKEKTKEEISKLANLSDKELKEAYKEIEAAANQNDLNTILAKYKNIDSKNLLDKQKEAAKKEINSNKNLTDTQKETFVKSIDEAKTEKDINDILAKAKVVKKEKILPSTSQESKSSESSSSSDTNNRKNLPSTGEKSNYYFILGLVFLLLASVTLFIKNTNKKSNGI